MLAALNRFDGVELRWSQCAPAQRVDNVVLERRMQGFECAHKSMSSTLAAPAAARSLTVISPSLSVS